jgi:hypothetical protein
MLSSSLKLSGRRHRELRDYRFFLAMAIISTLVVFLGFGRTYYLQSYFGTPKLTVFLAAHGLVFTIWMLYFIAQTALINSTRFVLHRRLGYAGAFLALAMAVLGLAVGFFAEKLHHAHGPNAPETVFLLAIGDVLTFSVFTSAGFIWRRNRQAHQRLMLMATVAGLLFPAIVRMPLIKGHPIAANLTYLFLLLIGPVYDFVYRRPIHPAYLWGFLFIVLTCPPIRYYLAATQTWHRIASRVTSPWQI